MQELQIMLTGHTGTGKSAVGHAIASLLKENGFNVTFIDDRHVTPTAAPLIAPEPGTLKWLERIRSNLQIKVLTKEA